MTVRTSMLHVRVDDDTKEKAGEALKAMGLSVSEAVRLFLNRVVAEQAIPFEMKVPNAETRLAMEEADAIVAERRLRFATADVLIADLEDTTRR